MQNVTDPGQPLDALLAQVGLGDRRAFAQLLDHVGSAAWQVVRIVLPNDRACAERAYTEVFADIWRTAPDFRPGDGPSARSWVLALAQRHAQRYAASTYSPALIIV